MATTPTPYEQLLSEINDLESQKATIRANWLSIEKQLKHKYDLKEGYVSCTNDPQLLANLKLQISLLEQGVVQAPT